MTLAQKEKNCWKIGENFDNTKSKSIVNAMEE